MPRIIVVHIGCSRGEEDVQNAEYDNWEHGDLTEENVAEYFGLEDLHDTEHVNVSEDKQTAFVTWEEDEAFISIVKELDNGELNDGED